MPHIDQTHLDESLLLAAKIFHAPLLQALAPKASPEGAQQALRALLLEAISTPERERSLALPAVELLARAPLPPAPNLAKTPFNELSRLAAGSFWPQAFEKLLPLSDPTHRDDVGDSIAHALLRSIQEDPRSRAEASRDMLAALEKKQPAPVALARQELALIDACLNGHWDDFKRLADRGANLRAFCGDWTPALAASCRGHAQILRDIFQRSPEAAHDADRSGNRPLILATFCDDEETFQIALDCCDPNAADKEGATALSCAIDRQRWTRALDLAKRCDLSQADPKGRRATHWLASTEIFLSSLVPANEPWPPKSDHLDDEDQTFVEALPQLLAKLCQAEGAFDPDIHGRDPFDFLDDYCGHPAVARWLREGMLEQRSQLEASQLRQSAAQGLGGSRPLRV